jgi:S1-C subfamily serine protease
VRLAAVVVAAGLLAGGCSLGGDDDDTTAPPAAAGTVTVTQVESTAEAPAAGASLADMVERVLPSVVNVRTTSFGGGSGEGSGVVLDRNGIIVTNNHVVEGTTRVNVALNDRRRPRTLRGEVIGVAPERDLAVIRVEASDLVPIRLGSSSALRLGDGVVAIGFPLGLGGPTVTQGIVSGLDRTIEPGGGVRLQGLLQTDAAINPGNSGGPLVDLDGRLIGINTAVARLQDAENIGFAIAIEGALPVIDRIRTPAAARAWFGISIGSVESDAAAVRLGLEPSVRGVVVSAVYPGQPAARAGLVVGDVIVSVGGRPIRSAAEYEEELARRAPGDEVELELVDSAGPRLVTVTLVRRPARVPG